MTTAKIRELTLRDVLSRLTLPQALKALGPRGRELLLLGGQREIPLDSVRMEGERLVVALPEALVTLALRDGAERRLAWSCSACHNACEHAGAALSLVLEEKLALGLAIAPDTRPPAETLAEDELVQRALAERAERARTERMTLRSSDSERPWTDYAITSASSGRTYRVALRGLERGESYCSCPDFRTNTLGTCKHVLHALDKVRKRFSSRVLHRPHRRRHLTLHLRYADDVELRLLAPEKQDESARRLLRPIAEGPIVDLPDLLQRLKELERLGQTVVIYPDAEQYVEQRLLARRLERCAAAIRKDPARHPLRRSLLKVELLPYQLDGIAFAVAAGRAVLADDMGLGKTIQAIGTAELLAREAGIRRVLVVAPASVKSQWLAEIRRFSDRSAELVVGSAGERARQYDEERFFTLCNYEQVLRDLPAIERVKWDLIVLDEAQRIKNWEARTSGVIKSLRSPFALALSGTPLENRIDELYSVVQFIDDRRLAPAFRFFHRHRVVDERGKVLGYKRLDELRRNLAPILLRRTRAEVLQQLPERTTEIVRLRPTRQQLDIHDGHLRTVAAIVAKAYISEMDLLRLQKALLMCRMAADGTFLVDKLEPGHSSKLEELDLLLGRLCAEEGRKIVLFSEWTSMLDRIEPLLERHGAPFVRLDGRVPQRKRQLLVRRFTDDPACTAFLATNAGATGLNLQAANTVVNVDLPWNPAILEQRIGRAHRMGQRRPVHVFLLVTEETIEERMLATLSAKHELFQAVLDADSPLDAVDLASGVEELKRRLEVLIGRRPEAPIDGNGQIAQSRELHDPARREKLAAAGGRLLQAAFEFLGEMLPPPTQDDAANGRAARIREQLSACLGEDTAGRPTLSFTLPDRAALDRFAQSLARLALQT